MITRCIGLLALLLAPSFATADFWIATLEGYSGKVWYVARYTQSQRPVNRKDIHGLRLKAGDRFRIGTGGAVRIRYIGTKSPKVLRVQDGYCSVERDRSAAELALGRELNKKLDRRMLKRGATDVRILSPADGDSLPLGELSFVRLKDDANEATLELRVSGQERAVSTLSLPKGRTEVANDAVVKNLRKFLLERLSLAVYVSEPGDAPSRRRLFFALSKHMEQRLITEIATSDAMHHDPFERAIMRAVLHSKYGCTFLAERDLLVAYRISSTSNLEQKLLGLALALGDTDTVDLIRKGWSSMIRRSHSTTYWKARSKCVESLPSLGSKAVLSEVLGEAFRDRVFLLPSLGRRGLDPLLVRREFHQLPAERLEALQDLSLVAHPTLSQLVESGISCQRYLQFS